MLRNDSYGELLNMRTFLDILDILNIDDIDDIG